jgi:hypothetical protein
LFSEELLPKILADRGNVLSALDAATAPTVWEQLKDDDCFKKKGDKIALSRWFQFLNAAEQFHKSWHTRFLYR